MGYASTLAEALNASQARNTRAHGRVYPSGNRALLSPGGLPLSTMPIAAPVDPSYDLQSIRAALQAQSAPAQSPGLTSATVYDDARKYFNTPTYDPTQQEQYRPWGGDGPITIGMPGSSDLEQAQEQDRLAASGISPERMNADLFGHKFKALQERNAMMDAISAPQREEYNAPAYPELQLPALPNRQAPRQDAMAGILAALGGFISPQYAGQLGAAPLQAGLANSEQQFGDAKQHYNADLQQLQMKHENLIQQRDDKIRADRRNQDVRYDNSVASVSQQMAKALRASEANEAGGVATVYDNADKVNDPAQKAGLAARQMRETMGVKEAQSAANQKTGSALLKMASDLQGKEDTNTTRQLIAQLGSKTKLDVADKGFAGKIDSANIRAKASINAANIRAEASKYGADKRASAVAGKLVSGGDAGLPKGIATLLRPYASTVSEAHKEYMKARATAAKRLGDEATGAAIDGDPNVRAAAAARDDATKAWNDVSTPYMKRAQEGLSGKPVLPGKSKTLDANTATQILKEVGGNKEKARALAAQRGYKL